MTNESKKRRRASTGAEEASSASARQSLQAESERITAMTDTLSADTLRRLLNQAAVSFPPIAKAITDEVDRLAEEDRRRVIDFDSCSKSIWKSINVTYKSLGGAKSYDMAFEVSSDIENSISNIAQQSDTATASFGTRKNAMETLRKIGKTMCLSDTAIAFELRKQYETGEILSSTMLSLAKRLTAEERQELRPWCDEKLDELRELSEGLFLFDSLVDVIDVFLEDESCDRGEESDP